MNKQPDSLVLVLVERLLRTPETGRNGATKAEIPMETTGSRTSFLEVLRHDLAAVPPTRLTSFASAPRTLRSLTRRRFINVMRPVPFTRFGPNSLVPGLRAFGPVDIGHSHTSARK